jgi:hypothetical protein
MTIEIVPEFFIHVTADNGKLLTNGEVETKEIFAPLNSDITNWVEIDEPIEILPDDNTN